MKSRYMMIAAVLLLSCAVALADECNSLRYSDNGDGTVTDCRTGLIWLKDANCLDTSNGIVKTSGNLNWYNAMKWVAGLGNGLCSLADGSTAGDWRLPTDTEWSAAVESGRKQGFTSPVITNAAGTAHWTANGDAFNNVMPNPVFVVYWASIRFGSVHAWRVVMESGVMDVDGRSNVAYVWPVRGGQSGTFGNLRIE